MVLLREEFFHLISSLFLQWHLLLLSQSPSLSTTISYTPWLQMRTNDWMINATWHTKSSSMFLPGDHVSSTITNTPNMSFWYQYACNMSYLIVNDEVIMSRFFPNKAHPVDLTRESSDMLLVAMRTELCRINPTTEYEDNKSNWKKENTKKNWQTF